MDRESDKSLTRREFLQATTAAGAATLLGGCVFANSLALEDITAPTTNIRIGLVGVGWRGTHLARQLVKFPGVEIRAVADPDRLNAEYIRDHVVPSSATPPVLYMDSPTDYLRLCERSDIDAVITATPWELHTPVMVAAMRAGKYAATEVPAAITIDECWQLVETSEETGIPCMMLENVCYFPDVLAILKMTRENVFGELLHFEAGYQHDVRGRMIEPDRQGNPRLTWRGQHALAKNGNLYPTHPIGPIAQWANINRGDRFTHLVSMSSKSRGLRRYARSKLGEQHPLAQSEWALGDINTTLIRTELGVTITLYHDTSNPRPYEPIFRVQGTDGLYMGNQDSIYIGGVSPNAEQYESFGLYRSRYEHPLWRDLKHLAEGSGHFGADYLTLYDFIKAVRNRTQPPQDVYDAATWSVIFPLTIESVAGGSKSVEIPDFTRGRWRTNPPFPIYGA